MPKHTQARLLRVATADSKLIASWNEGISLAGASSTVVPSLIRQIAAARLALAYNMRATALRGLSAQVASFRTGISRCYYAMYHSMRASAYVYYSGDDHEKHSVLPAKIPDDFPSQQHWANQLKSAREYRNRADYEPYPRTTTDWKAIATIVSSDMNSLLPIARKYLRSKGCKV